MSEPSLSSFSYAPLQDSSRQIRLLELRPIQDEKSETISCSISVHSLQDAPLYSAISYTWGKPEPLLPITINSSVLYIRENCYRALLQARYQGSSHVWIDSICINQHDTSEKSAQVSMMAAIYGRATRVLSCVGQADDNSRELLMVAREFHSLQLISEDAAVSHETRTRWQDWISSKGDWYMTELYNKYKKFSERDYWHRLWVVQEIYAGHGSVFILCGDDLFDWRFFKTISNILDVAFGGGEDLFNLKSIDVRPASGLMLRSGLNSDMFDLFPLDTIIEIISAAPLPLDSPSMIDTMRMLRCAEPLDHIYGILSLLKWPDGQSPITPDYKKPVFTLAREVLRLISKDLPTASNVLRGLTVNLETVHLGLLSRSLSLGQRLTHRWETTATCALRVGRTIDGALEVFGGEWDTSRYPADEQASYTSVEILYHSTMVMRASYEVEANDIILQCQPLNVLLVLRELASRTLEVIGIAGLRSQHHGVPLRNTGLQCSCFPVGDSTFLRTWPVSLNISDEDAMLLVANPFDVDGMMRRLPSGLSCFGTIVENVPVLSNGESLLTHFADYHPAARIYHWDGM